MAVYLIIALTIYALINLYVLRRAWQGAAGMGWVRPLVLGILLFLTLAYPVARFLERIIPGWLTESLDRLGSVYFVVMFYAFFILLLIDLLRLANHFLPLFPQSRKRRTSARGPHHFPGSPGDYSVHNHRRRH